MVDYLSSACAKVLIALCYAVATLALAALMAVGWALGRLYAAEGWPEPGGAGNCWSYAVPLWLRDSRKFLVVTMSRFAPVPHVYFAPSIEGLPVSEFKPLAPKRGLRGALGAFWFAGRVRSGLGEERRQA